MAVVRCGRSDLAQALSSLDLPEDLLIWVADAAISDDWEDIRGELSDAFEASQRAVKVGAPIVYIVDGDDLLGRNGAGRAMVACGVLSAARTGAIESRMSGVGVNIIAVEADTATHVVGSWVKALAKPKGPQGELIRLGGDHLGKALP
jgi:hypothetical protein